MSIAIDKWNLIPIRSRLGFCRDTLMQIEQEALDLGLDELAETIALAKVKTGEAFRMAQPHLENR